MSRGLHRAVAGLASRPGADPRVNLAYAVVNAFEVRPGQGVFADITLLPNGPDETCYLGGPYAGGGFGAWFPFKEGETILVAQAHGDPQHGPICVARAWNSGDPPPAEIQGASDGGDPPFHAPSTDVWLRVEDGHALRIRTSGGDIKLEIVGAGNVTLLVGDGEVRLATDAPGPLDGLVHGSGLDAFTGATYTALGNASTKVKGAKGT